MLLFIYLHLSGKKLIDEDSEEDEEEEEETVLAAGDSDYEPEDVKT